MLLLQLIFLNAIKLNKNNISIYIFFNKILIPIPNIYK